MANCQIEQQLTKIDEQLFAELMAQKMFGNELMGGRIFRNNFKRLRSFFGLAVSHAAKHAQIITCRNDDGKIIAGAIVYDRPLDKDITFDAVKSDHGLFRTLGFVLASGIGNVNRLSEMEKKYHKYTIKEPHIYIQFVASAEKGMGTEVLNFLKQHYNDRIIYLESSVTKNDHAYYRNQGFTEFARVNLFDFEQVLFIRPAIVK